MNIDSNNNMGQINSIKVLNKQLQKEQ